MTEAQKLLALAERLGHKALLGREAFANGERHDPDGVYLCLDDGLQLFDPANNGDQAIAVLAWLLRNFRCDLSHNAVTVWHSNDILICDIDYDGTAAGLRKAVTEAGMRVV